MRGESGLRGLACQRAWTERRMPRSSAVFRMESRCGPSRLLSSQPTPLFISGNHSNASKPLANAYSKGSVGEAAENAVWLPILIIGWFEHDGERGGSCGVLWRGTFGQSHLWPGLDDIVVSFGDGSFDILRRAKGFFDLASDAGDGG